jgi:site-specific recombinase XerD
MAVNPSITLREKLRLPVEVLIVDDLPKVMAGNLPVTPINIALKQKREQNGATTASLETYVRAARLFVEFAAHRGRSLADVTNEEFRWFVQALLGNPFLNDERQQVKLSGERGPRTADLMLSLLYSLAAIIQELYEFRFEWLKYRNATPELIEIVRVLSGHSHPLKFRREHRIAYTPTVIQGLPDEEFERMLLAAYDNWGKSIAHGDMANSDEPESQKGALFYRNIGILLLLRLEGARRSEPPFLQLEDIDRANSLIYLVTKGKGGERGKRLPVTLHPLVEAATWVYVTKYRPVTEENAVPGYPAFVSHSSRNYGQHIGAQCIRKIIDALRYALTPPWDKRVSPHTLRHSFAVNLQMVAGDAATVINMRHASLSSLKPYLASPEIFADELRASADPRLLHLLDSFGIKLSS